MSDCCNCCPWFRTYPMPKGHYSSHCCNPAKPEWLGKDRTIDYGFGDGPSLVKKPAWCKEKANED